MNTYTVIMLGGRESGKTVFLASLDKKLSTQGDRGFFLEIENNNNRKILKDLYLTIYPGSEEQPELWPDANQLDEISQWIFNCKVENVENNSTYTTCKFKYLDYAGGQFTNQGYGQQLEQKITEASVILCLLDGVKIKSYINGERKGLLWAGKDLSLMLDIVQQNRQTVYFLISKWDVLGNKNDDLKAVREKLLEIEPFKNIIKLRCRIDGKIGARLIPISSVGSGFAELQEDGSMKKIEEKQPDPFQVEMPLACVLQDMIQNKVADLTQQLKNVEDQKVQQIVPNLTLTDKLTRIGGGVLKQGIGILKTTTKLDPDILELLVNLTDQQMKPSKDKEEFARKRTEELETDKKESLKKIKDEKTAFESVIKSFAYLVNKLEKDFPSSKFDDINFE